MGFNSGFKGLVYFMAIHHRSTSDNIILL